MTTSTTFVSLLPASLAHAGPGCQDNSTLLVFARGSQDITQFNAGEAAAFFNSVRNALGSNPSSTLELGNIDGDGSLDPLHEYPAVGMLDWRLLAGMGGYYDSVYIGSQELSNFLNNRYENGACSGEAVVIGGYSQGSEVVNYGVSGLGNVALRHVAYVAHYGGPRYAPCKLGVVQLWVKVNVGCVTGRLGAYLPYTPPGLESRTGSWCDPLDGICTGNLQNLPLPGLVSTHTGAQGAYANSNIPNFNGYISQSAPEIAAAARSKLAELNPPPLPTGLTLAAASHSNGEQYVFWKGGGGGVLWEAWYANGVWNGPKPFPQFGTLWSAPTVAVNPLNGHQHVFWKSGGGSLMHAWWDGAWHGPQDLGMGPLGSAPSATAFGNEIDVFWKGTDGNLWEAWWNGSVWQGPKNLGMGVLGSPPSAIAYANGEQHVFWKSGGNELMTARYAGGSWHGPEHIQGMGPLASQPTAVYRPTTGERDVFWRGTDGNIWEAVWLGGTTWYGPFCVGMGILGSPPTATAWGTEIDVFWVSNGGGVLMEGYYQNQSWHGPGARGMSVIPVQP